MTDRLTSIFAEQYEQQADLMGSLPAGRVEQREMAERFSNLLIGQVHDYLTTTGQQSFWPADESPRSARVGELVDIFKYLLCMCWTEGVTPEELHEMFRAKTRLVNHRHHQNLIKSHIAGFDLDGTLCEYGTWGPTEEEFIERGGALELKLLPGAKDLLCWLKGMGWSIVIVTARKAHIYPRLEMDTLDWCAANELPVDRVLFGYDKTHTLRQYSQQLRFFVDDSIKHVLDMAAGSIPVYHMGHCGESRYKWVTNVPDLFALRKHLEEWVVAV